jgi:hypothetical protein
MPDPEAALRELWTAQGVPPERQDEVIAAIVAKAKQRIVFAPPPKPARRRKTIAASLAANPPGLPGILPARTRDVLQREADRPLAGQNRPVDDTPLFGPRQRDLFD